MISTRPALTALARVCSALRSGTGVVHWKRRIGDTSSYGRARRALAFFVKAHLLVSDFEVRDSRTSRLHRQVAVALGLAVCIVHVGHVGLLRIFEQAQRSARTSAQRRLA